MQKANKNDGLFWRRGWDSNPRMEVLQTSPLGLLGTAPNARQYIEKQRRMSGRRAGTKSAGRTGSGRTRLKFKL